MYAHLNTISVNVGQKLKKGDIIGQTGSTGLAGGDHLHFGMLIQHTFVNPIEWWDLQMYAELACICKSHHSMGFTNAC